MIQNRTVRSIDNTTRSPTNIYPNTSAGQLKRRTAVAKAMITIATVVTLKQIASDLRRFKSASSGSMSSF